MVTNNDKEARMIDKYWLGMQVTMQKRLSPASQCRVKRR